MSVLQIKQLPCERFMCMYFTEVIRNDISVYIKEKKASFQQILVLIKNEISHLLKVYATFF